MKPEFSPTPPETVGLLRSCEARLSLSSLGSHEDRPPGRPAARLLGAPGIRVLVKEFNLSYHNKIDPSYGNLDEVPYQEPSWMKKAR